MAKTRLGFDIGNHSVKIASATKSGTAFYEIPLPDHMMQDGGIQLPNAFSDFLKKERKRLKIPKGDCALVLPPRQVICRTVTLPKMSTDQLMLNLPYEFSDFIQDDVDKFLCDYAMCDPEEGESPDQMTMMAATASKERITSYIRMFAGAGLKLKVLLPPEMALINLVKQYRERNPGAPLEYCFVDVGQESVKITVIKKDRVQARRNINLGCSSIDRAIAEMMNVDAFLAGTYKLSNYQNVLESQECQDVCGNIAVEILKVLNFYQYNYRDSHLEGIYLTGGGAAVAPLREAIQNVVDMPFLQTERLIAGGVASGAGMAAAAHTEERRESIASLGLLAAGVTCV